MYERKEAGDYIWIIPLIAACLAVIAIFTPTAHFGLGDVTWDWWMWNLTMLDVYGYEPVTLFISEVDFIIPSVITTIAVIFSAINLIILSITAKRRKLDTKNFELRSVLSAVLSMGIMIYYSIAMGSAFYDGVIIEGVPFPPGIHFWFEFNPSFGIFLPFISAILSFIGLGLFRKQINVIKYKMDPNTGYVPYSKTVPNTGYIPYAKQLGSVNFCPECGKKVLHTGVKFCTNCGFNLK
jgi:hypothetical protein